MTPSIQSQDHTVASDSSEGPQSAMLFTAPKGRPSRILKPVGPGFGRDTLKPPISPSDTTGTCVSVSPLHYVCVHVTIICNMLRTPCLSLPLASQDDTGKSELAKLKRRFLRDRTTESSFFAKWQLKKKLLQEVN